MFVLIFPARVKRAEDGVLVYDDAGQAVTFASVDEALLAAQRHGLERAYPHEAVNTERLIDPAPYHEGMTFDAAKGEARRLLNYRERRKLLGR